MASSLPVVQQVALFSIVPQGIVLLLLVGAAQLLGSSDPFLIGVACYVVVHLALRHGVAAHHRKGMRLYKKERFAEAAAQFEKSYEFFSRHAWLDRWRAVTMLSSSRVSYREMALLNIAFCLVQTGKREQAAALYRRVLDEFPGSKVAQTALRMLEPSALG